MLICINLEYLTCVKIHVACLNQLTIDSDYQLVAKILETRSVDRSTCVM